MHTLWCTVAVVMVRWVPEQMRGDALFLSLLLQFSLRHAVCAAILTAPKQVLWGWGVSLVFQMFVLRKSPELMALEPDALCLGPE